MMMHAPLLQDFDQFEQAEQDSQTPSVDFEAGYTKGVEEGFAQAQLDATLMTASAAQAIADMAFGYVEARAHFLALLEPLFESLTAHLLPKIARETLPAHIAEALKLTALSDVAGPVEIAIHPENIARLDDLMRSNAGFPIHLCADPALGLGQAQIFRPSGDGTALDVDGVVHEIITSLAALFDESDERIA